MRKQVCDLYREIKSYRKATVSLLAQEAVMSRTQINNILNHNGKEVTLERMLDGLSELGVEFTIKAELE